MNEIITDKLGDGDGDDDNFSSSSPPFFSLSANNNRIICVFIMLRFSYVPSEVGRTG